MTAQGLSQAATAAPEGRGRFFQLSDQRRRAIRRFRQSPLSMAGLAIIVALLAVALVGPLFVPYPKDATGRINIREKLDPPSLVHLFGTDQVGRDVFTRVIVGARVSLLAGLVVIALALTIGTLLGAIAGFFGGRTSETIMRVTDIFLTIPEDRKSTRLNSSHSSISYAVFCLKKKRRNRRPVARPKVTDSRACRIR